MATGTFTSSYSELSWVSKRRIFEISIAGFCRLDSIPTVKPTVSKTLKQKELDHNLQ